MTPLRDRLTNVLLQCYHYAPTQVVEWLVQAVSVPATPSWCHHVTWIDGRWLFTMGEPRLRICGAEAWDHCPVKGCHAQRPSDG